MSLNDFKNRMAKGIYGITSGEAREKNVCIQCKKNMDAIGFPTQADKDEYEISGLCHLCWDEIFN